MQEFITSSPVLHALAVTLIHFVWQGLVIAAVVKILFSLIDRKRPVIRYAISSIAMIVSLLVPLATFSYFYKPLVNQDASQLGLLALDPITAALNRPNSMDWYQNSGDLLPYLAVIWLVWVSFLTIRLVFDIARVQRLPFNQVIATEPALQQKFEQLVKQLGLNKVPKLVISLSAEVPMAIGWLKPVVLMPAKMILGLNQAQLEMLLLHELAHIKRYDYLVNFLQTMVEILLFFHPAVLWISKQMRQEREYCSDDIAVAHCGNPIAYAHTLADTAEICDLHRHSTIPTMAMAASGGDLKDRVYRLVNHSCTDSANPGKWLAGTTLAIGLVLGVTTLSSKQLQNIPLFDLTSVGINFFSAQNNSKNLALLNEPSSTPAEFSIAQQLLEPKQSTAGTTNTILAPELTKDNSGNYSKLGTTNVGTLKSDTYTQNNLLAINESPSIGNPVNKNTDEIGNAWPPSESTSQLTDSKNVDQAYLASAHMTTEKVSKNNVLPARTRQFESSQQSREINLDDTRKQTKVLAAYDTKKDLNPYAKQLQSLSQPNQEQNDIALQLQDSEVTTLSNAENVSEVDVATKRFEKLLAKHASAKSTVQELGLFEQRYNAKPNKSVKRNANLTYAEDPKYPSVAKRKGIELEVFVSFTIDEDGKVSNIQFEKQSKLNYFKSSINTALKKWRFEPALENGQPVQSTMSKIFSFNLS